MLGRTSGSISSALPGGGGGSTFLGQKFYGKLGTFNDVVPEGAFFAFVEAISQGGTSDSQGGARGGTGNDAIVAVSPGAAIQTALPTRTVDRVSVNINSVTVTIGGILVLTAGNPGPDQEAAGTGKYPGTAGTGTSHSGGGRLAGQLGAFFNGTLSRPFGAGSPGRFISSGWSIIGAPAACLSFFSDYDSAFVFAKSLYGGTWS